MQPKFGTFLRSLLIATVLFASAAASGSAGALGLRKQVAQAGSYIISGNAAVGGATLSYDDGSPQLATKAQAIFIP